MIEPCAMCESEGKNYFSQSDWHSVSCVDGCGLRSVRALSKDKAIFNWNRMQRLLRDGLAVEWCDQNGLRVGRRSYDYGGTNWSTYRGSYVDVTAPTLHEAVAKSRGDE